MATLYCDCGHKLWSELWWRGQTHELILYDGENLNGRPEKVVTQCPGCDRLLRRALLRPASYEPGSSLRGG